MRLMRVDEAMAFRGENCCISAHSTRPTRASARRNDFRRARSRQSRSLPFIIPFPTPLFKAKVRVVSSTSANKSHTRSRPTPVFHSQRRLLFFIFFGRFLVSVRLPLFAYMSLNYVAILYKSLHVSTSKYYPVLPLISVCSSSPSNSSLLSLLALSRPHSRPCSLFTVDLASQHLDVTRIDQQTSLVIPPVAHLLKLQKLTFLEEINVYLEGI